MHDAAIQASAMVKQPKAGIHNDQRLHAGHLRDGCGL